MKDIEQQAATRAGVARDGPLALRLQSGRGGGVADGPDGQQHSGAPDEQVPSTELTAAAKRAGLDGRRRRLAVPSRGWA
eukprot:2511614-Alexandrium_andersonii.AAC.1